MARSQLSDLFARLHSVSIGVIGDFCLDAYWQLDEADPELSHETGKPTLAVTEQRYSLGGAGNVVNNLAALGAGKVLAFGVLGDDLFGGEVFRQFAKSSTDITGLILQHSGWQSFGYLLPDCICGQGCVPSHRVSIPRLEGSWPDVSRKSPKR
jgi:hypothetical protein